MAIASHQLLHFLRSQLLLLDIPLPSLDFCRLSLALESSVGIICLCQYHNCRPLEFSHFLSLSPVACLSFSPSRLLNCVRRGLFDLTHLHSRQLFIVPSDSCAQSVDVFTRTHRAMKHLYSFSICFFCRLYSFDAAPFGFHGFVAWLDCTVTHLAAFHFAHW